MVSNTKELSRLESFYKKTGNQLVVLYGRSGCDKEKLIMSTTNKLKNDLISIIFAGGKELSDFKVVIREGDLK